MSNAIKTQDVTRFLSDMIDLTMSYTVDAEGYVVSKTSGEKVLIGDGKDPAPILLYQEEIKDSTAFILNPLAGGLGETPSAQWFYRVQRVALMSRVGILAETLLQIALTSKQRAAEKTKKTDKESEPLAVEVIKIISPIMEDIDEKTLTEFSYLLKEKDASELVTIYYRGKQIESKLRSGVLDHEDETSPHAWKAKFPRIRKVTWTVLEKLFLGIFSLRACEDMATYTRKADVIACARLSSTLNVLLAVYQRLNPLLEEVHQDMAIDLGRLAHHVTYLKDYSENARFMVQAIAPRNPGLMVPGTAPSVPSASSNVLPNPYGMVLIPGPVMADGRQSQPIPLMSAPSGGLFGAPPPFLPPGVPGPAYAPPSPYADTSRMGYQTHQPAYNSYYTPPIQPNTYFTNSPMSGMMMPPPGAPQGYRPMF